MNEKYRLPFVAAVAAGRGCRGRGGRRRPWLAGFEREERGLDPSAFAGTDADGDTSADADRPAVDAGGGDARVLRCVRKGMED